MLEKSPQNGLQRIGHEVLQVQEILHANGLERLSHRPLNLHAALVPRANRTSDHVEARRSVWLVNVKRPS